MTTITQRAKKSIWVWVIIIAIVAVCIVVGVLAYLGYISLQFLADGIIAYCMFGTASWVNAILVVAAPFVLGIITWYVIAKYFIGQKVKVPATTYQPAGQTISPSSQQESETVIS